MRKLLILSIFLILAAACVPVKSIDTELTLSKGEHWQSQAKIVVPPEIGMLEEVLNNAISEEMRRFELGGIDVSWRQTGRDREGNVSYTMTLKGQGYDKLNTLVLDQGSVQVDESSGTRNIIFDYYFGAGDIFSSAMENTFTLRGGRILSSNGNQLNKSMVQWINPSGRLQAVLTEASGSNWIWYLLIILIVAGGFVVYWMSRQGLINLNIPYLTTAPKTTPQPSQYYFCAHCGTQMQPQAKFCPNCGAQRGA